MPEVPTLICDVRTCSNIGTRYWYSTIANKVREVILCMDHDVFRNSDADFAQSMNSMSRPSRREMPKVRRRPTVTEERLDAMYVGDPDNM